MVSETATKTWIVGLGVTGLSVARYLAARGESFAIADSRAEPPHRQELQSIAPDATLVSGEFDAARFAGADRLIVSPGVAVRHPAVVGAVERGVEVVGDIELFAREATAPIVAVTGSNGKSTVTSLVAEMARRAGRRAAAGGNLGAPALDLLGPPEPELYVLELSSFQLETTAGLAPAAAVVLNVSADHLDRYDSLGAYAAAKARIFRNACVAVVNRDDARVAAMEVNGRRVSFGSDTPPGRQFGLRVVRGRSWLCRGTVRLIEESEIELPGRHNTLNALAALALGEAAGLPLEAMLETLSGFAGLPHRCQRVAEQDGIVWYDDSKATNVGAALAALHGLTGRTVLIAGGEGKGQDFAPLRAAVQDKARAVVLLGRDAARIEQALGGAAPIVHVRDMRSAVRQAASAAKPGDNVLLAPACASFDQYRDYNERGEDFIRAVRELLA